MTIFQFVVDGLTFEDSKLKKKDFSAANFNIISKIALAILEKDTTFKASKKQKRLKAALDDRYREKLLKGINMKAHATDYYYYNYFFHFPTVQIILCQHLLLFLLLKTLEIGI